jgi:uncharacterized membrane protein YdjX (TVP38/TMEM64 family)
LTSGKRKLLVLAGVVLLLVVGGTLLMQQIPATVSKPLFILVVIVEVIVAPIPGGAIGYLGAARFGFWGAWPLLYLGNIVGTTIAFFLARRIGTPIFEENVSERTRARYDHILTHHPALLWAAYSVPLIPVDVLSVLAGLSHISARRFLFIVFTGYSVYTAIVASVGAYLARFIGVMEAMSVLGVIVLAGIVWWLWKEVLPVDRRRSAARNPAQPHVQGDGDTGPAPGDSPTRMTDRPSP